MYFTREPIIETIITPREGYKLVVSNTKKEVEPFKVDALEVVVFGSSVFFRSLSRNTKFMVPVSDYEVLEIKDSSNGLKYISKNTVKVTPLLSEDSVQKESKPQEEKKKKENKKKKTSSNSQKSIKQDNKNIISNICLPPPKKLIFKAKGSIDGDRIFDMMWAIRNIFID